MAKFIKDGFVQISTGMLDIRLKLDNQAEHNCRKAYDAMCRMIPFEWDLSYTLRKQDNMKVDVSLTSSHGCITMREVPIKRLIDDIHFGYQMAQLTMNYIDYNRIIQM